MALFDFLKEPVGGSTDVPEVPTSEAALFGGVGNETIGGGAYKQPNSNMTWGQLLGAIARMSNTSGGQGLGSFMGAQYGAVGSGIPPQQAAPQIYNIGPDPNFNKVEKKEQTSAGEIAQIAALFG